MGVIGLCLLAGMVVFGGVGILAFSAFPTFLVEWLAWLTLACGVFGMAFPFAHAVLLVFCYREIFNERPAWLRSAFLGIHWLVYIPYVAFMVAPPLVDLFPCSQTGDSAAHFLVCSLFTACAAAPAQWFLCGRWPFEPRPKPRPWSLPKPPPEIAIRRRPPTVPPRVHSRLLLR